MTRATTFAVVAAAMARAEASLGTGDVDPFRLAISLGVGGMGPIDVEVLDLQATIAIACAHETSSDVFDIPSFARIFRERANPITALRILPTTPRRMWRSNRTLVSRTTPLRPPAALAPRPSGRGCASFSTVTPTSSSLVVPTQ